MKPFERVKELSAFERETVILFNEAEPDAVLATSSKAMMNKMMKIVNEFDEFRLTKVDEWGAEFTFPKTHVSIRKPRAMTPEQKSSAAQRLEQIRMRIQKNREKP